MPLWRKYLQEWKFRHRRSSGSLQRLSGVYSPELGNRRDVLVYLPASYGRSDLRYPVIYMQDGQNLFDPATSFAGDWGLGTALPRAERKGAEAIVVAVPNMGADRIGEYSPFVDPENGGGRGDLYLDFLIDTLRPTIDREFRTFSDPARTGIAGSSMGGLISLYAVFRHPEVFGFAGALSPSVWFAKAAVLDFVETAPRARARIYLDVGTSEGGDALGYARRLRDTLIRKGYRLDEELLWVEEKGGTHNEAAWGRRFGRAVPFLLDAGGRS